jgi:hypothetical protein
LFRHSAGADLAKANVDPSHRRRTLRHANLPTTDTCYTHLGHEDLRANPQTVQVSASKAES